MLNRLSILLFLLLILSGCGKSVLSQTSKVLNRSLPDETSNNVNIYSYNQNRLDYLLTASKIERYYDLKRLWAWKVKITTYDEKGNVKSTIVADTTFVDEARNFIKAVGNVVLSSPNGTIKSHIITWDRNIDEIYCPEKVVLIREGNTLVGDNLRTDVNITFAEMNSVSAEGTLQGDELAW